jgi:hypothetical protein
MEASPAIDEQEEEAIGSILESYSWPLCQT